MFVRSKNCACPKCGIVSMLRHGTYESKLQALPLLGKVTWLFVNEYEYQCDNPERDIATFVETVNGFLNCYNGMIDRCADCICTLAMETSYEDGLHICKAMNLKISGDSAICLLTKHFYLQEGVKCGSIIDVDGFALKRYIYGTLTVYETTHTPGCHF